MIDIYNTSEFRNVFDRRINADGGMIDLLERRHIQRRIISFLEPISLCSIADICDSVSQSELGEGQKMLLNKALELVLSENIDDLGKDKVARVGWSGPVDANAEDYFVHAIESWFFKRNTRDVFGLFSLYGFTDPEKTTIQGEAICDQPLSTAFQFLFGYDPMNSFLLRSLGRDYGMSWSDQRRWFSKINLLGGVTLKAAYISTPFSVPDDVIYYPHPEEYGSEGRDNPVYLEKSLLAKSMIKQYFELILEDNFPVKNSLVHSDLASHKDERSS